MNEVTQTKQCCKCGKVKPLTAEFFISHVGCRNGLSGVCLICGRAYARSWYEKNRELTMQRAATRYIKNRDGINTTRKEQWKTQHDVLLAKQRVYNASRREAIRERDRKYWSAHPEARNKKFRRAFKNRYLRDPAFVMVMRLRARLGCALRAARAKKSAGTMKLVGCTPQQLMEHIQKQFKPGMAWNNRHLWHLDHIRPCSSFDLLDPEQQRQCFHFTNLQPLWAKENHLKSDKWDKELMAHG